MKKLVMMLVVIALLVSTSFAFPRRVLIEEYTAQWCGPCGTTAPAFHEWMEDYLINDEITVLITHVSTDPWYDQNPTVCSSRTSYYGITTIPTACIDGLSEYYPGYLDELTNGTNSRLNVESPLEILLASSSTSTQTTITATVNSADEAVLGDYVIRFALSSDFYDNYSGSNGLEEWHYDLLDMSPGWDGFPFEISENSTETFSTSFTWPYYLQEDEVEWNNSHIVAYVQNVTTKEVIQSNWIQVSPPPYNHLVTTSANYRITDPETSVDVNLDFRNRGLNEDTYSVAVTSTLPDGWSYSYSTPDGDQNGSSNFTLSGESEFNSVITVTTGDIGGEYGSLEFTFTSQTEITNIQTTEVFVMCAPDILILDASEQGDNSTFYIDALSPLIGDKTVATWIKNQYPIPGADLTLDNTEMIIWFGAFEAPSEEVSEGIASAINSGTSIFTSGQILANSMRSSDLNELLGFESTSHYSGAVNAVSPEGSIFGDLSIELGGGDGADNLGDDVSTFAPLGGEAAFLYNGIPTRRAAISYTTETYNALTLGFPFEAIASAQERTEVMEIVYNFLNHDTNGIENQTRTDLPVDFSLEQNYPNPFNPSTSISFTIPSPCEVKMRVYNVSGQLVSTIVENKMDAGKYTMQFNGSLLSSGIYLLQLQAGDFQCSKKMVLCK